MFKMRIDVDSMQLLDQKVFKMHEEHVKNSFQFFTMSKTCKHSTIFYHSHACCLHPNFPHMTYFFNFVCQKTQIPKQNSLLLFYYFIL